MTDTAARLQLYIDAEAKILKGQRVAFGDRQLSYPDLPEVRQGIKELKAALAAETAATSGQFGPRVLVGGFDKPLS